MVKIRDILSDSELDELKRNPIGKTGLEPEYMDSRRGFRDSGIVIDNLHVLYKKVRWGDKLIVGVWDKTTPVAEVVLNPVSWQNIRAYSVNRAVVVPRYQGQGIGEALYHGLITLLDINLLSNGSHSPGARKLWLKLAKDPSIKAYGFDTRTNQLFNVKPNKQKSELVSAKRGTLLYDNYASGLILVKRNGSDDRKLDTLLKHSMVKPKKDPFGTKEFDPLGTWE